MQSSICTATQLFSDDFQFWAEKFLLKGLYNRKAWEWAFICQSFKEHGSLRPDAFGLGFGVGGEPLVSCFAAYGPRVLATDLDYESAEMKGWVQGNQHAKAKESLNKSLLCPSEQFEKLVEFLYVDMNDIPPSLNNSFDFLWSSCALEHLGSITKGVEFVANSINCLKRGGIAVHTTEYNVSSNDETIESGPTVLFRKQDIGNLIDIIRAKDCFIDINWDPGTHFKDYFVDLPPYGTSPHLKLRIQEFTVTSIGLVMVKQ